MENLLRWFRSDACPACGRDVSRQAVFCGHCGASRAGGWRTCEACGATCGAESTCCHACQANLSSQTGARVFDDVWRRLPSDVAVRVPMEVSNRALRSGIQVDDGCRAIVCLDGVPKAELPPGHHPWMGVTSGLAGEGVGRAREVILVADGEFRLPIRLATGLNDANRVPVEAMVELRVSVGDLRVFRDCWLAAGASVVEQDQLAQSLVAEAQSALRPLLATMTVEEITGCTREAELAEEAMRPLMERECAARGLVWLGVSLARFGGPAVDRLRALMADASQAEGEQRWRLRMAEIRRSGEMEKLRTDADYADYAADLQSRLRLKDAERRELDELWRIQSEARLDRLRNEHSHTRRTEDALRQEELRRITREHEQHEQLHRQALEASATAADLAALREVSAFQEERFGRWTALKAARPTPAERAAGSTPPPALPATPARDVTLRRMELEGQLRVMASARGVAVEALTAADGPAVAALLGELERLRANPSPAGGGIASVFDAVRPSVGLVVVAGADGVLEPVATAWAWRDDLFATNAHVAGGPDLPAGYQRRSVFRAMAEGRQCWVVPAAGHEPGFLYRIRAVAAHPLFPHGGTGNEPPVPAFDVGLLRVDRPVQCPLRVADDFSHLRPGLEVAFTGFPMQSIPGRGLQAHRPAPVEKTGRLTRLTDWHCGVADASGSVLLHTDLLWSGGASGSPLVDAGGRVIGVLSAVSKEEVMGTGGQRAVISSAAGNNFAMRADLLAGVPIPTIA